MADLEESSPLLGPQSDAPHHDKEKEPRKTASAPPPPPPPAVSVTIKQSPSPPPLPPKGPFGPTYGWMADGVPLGRGSAVGEPVCRAGWSSGLFDCLGRNDEFCSSDVEVCLLGSVAPCVLYGSNVERLGSVPGTFSSHCLRYAGAYLIGNSLFGANVLAPWFSYPSRTAIRHTFNKQGSCGSFVDDEECESLCDRATHIFCHACALCQEARELRRRLPHPGFKDQPRVLVMFPPGGQAMGRDGV
ncbi:cell number regulator 8-like [Rhododendron vialii]|uniref:cell number regulator 8-like n=1 Tax=Rhododendron vialii TaxID=182163 RepID=UPI00265E9DFF|nr:cell number regulator 8-like [Rhododendron vialii]